jgi:nitrous oxide reductase accessory protein NosL
MNKITKTLLAGILFVSFAVAGCNSGDADKAATADSSAVTTTTTTTTTTMEVEPAKKDTSKVKKDKATTRPTPGGG